MEIHQLSQIRGQWFNFCCRRKNNFSFLDYLFGTRLYEAFLTALLGYFSVLLEYIDLFHGFQPHSRKDNFGKISFQGGLSPTSADQGRRGPQPPSPPPPPPSAIASPICCSFLSKIGPTHVLFVGPALSSFMLCDPFCPLPIYCHLGILLGQNIMCFRKTATM